MLAQQGLSNFLDSTVEIVSSFVSQNTLRSSELPELIASVYASLSGLDTPKASEAPPPELKPAVSIKKSVTDDYLICLEDGKKFKSLKRHLQQAFGLSPDEYRAKWGLARDYPMVAPGYAAKRSELAKASGLGSNRRKPATAPAPEPVQQPAKKPRSRAAAVQQAA